MTPLQQLIEAAKEALDHVECSPGNDAREVEGELISAIARAEKEGA